jgi:predicted DNA-binding protein with PD1-like motif
MTETITPAILRSLASQVHYLYIGSHIHINVADTTRNTIGRHISEGCKVYTIAEIIPGESKQLIFTREKDGTTPWKELQIKHT